MREVVRWRAAVAVAGIALLVLSCGDGAVEPDPRPAPVPTTVTITPASASMTSLGETARFTAEVRDQNGQAMTGAAVAWASSDASVAAVDASGLVTAAANGRATITATAGSAFGTAGVTVTQVVSVVAVSPAADTLVAFGDTVRLLAEATDANGHVVAGAEFSWSSSDTRVVRVDDSGLVESVGEGSAVVMATASEVTGGAELSVVPPIPTTISASPDTIGFTALGQIAQLAVEVREQAGRVMAEAFVTWSSGDTLVAAVDSAGLVTAVGGGTTTVTAAAGDVSDAVVVTVMQSAGSVVISPSDSTIEVGDTLRLAAEAFDENGHAVNGATFSWSSSNAGVASVDESGLVEGVAEGTARITARAGDASGVSEITVENPDRAALVALYEATDGPNWVNSENWLTDAPLGEWYGVGTDADGRVRRLWLLRNGLSGLIPPELGRLSRLFRLALMFNVELTGSIPPELGSLSRLRELYLFANGLTGTIPPELGNLANLDQLDFRRNRLTGSIPPELGALAELRHLGLEHNELTGPIPPELGNLANLFFRLDLSYNGLTGSIPPELGNLANLDWALDLSNNKLTGSIPPELGNLSALTRLSLSSNNLTGEIPWAILSMPRLETLHLAGNPGLCAPADPDILARLKELNSHPYLCRDPNIRLLPSALMREDGNGMSFALPDDLRAPSAVTVSNPSVVGVSVADGWLELSPRGIGFAEVELVPVNGGKRAVAEVTVRESVGTFGIDVFVEQPAPIGYVEAMAEAADWWSDMLDGTEWPDRAAGCPSWNGFDDKVKAVADELLIGARAQSFRGNIAGYANGCFFPKSGGRAVPALDPGGGYVVVRSSSVTAQSLLRHEIGHLLGLVAWRSTHGGLATSDCRFFTGSHAVEAFRAGGGNPSLPGVPIQTGCGGHWRVSNELMMSPGAGQATSLSLGALVDAGYTVDLSKALPWNSDSGPAARVVGDEVGRDVVFGEPRVFIERRPRNPTR